MAVPDFQSIMLPLLTMSGDGKVRSLAESRGELAEQLSLTDADLGQLLPSGTQPMFNNRVAWAVIYLQRAGLLSRPMRAHYQITDEGRRVLATPPDKINIKFLSQFEGFNEFRKKPPDAEDREGDDDDEESATPEESLEQSYQKLKDALAEEILAQVKNCSPVFFERLVVELLVKMGYGGSRRDAGAAVGRSGDEGIDGIIQEDRLGLDVIYIQAKKWDGAVGRPEIQKFVGALHGKHARKGVFLTTGSFSQGARDYSEGIDPKIVLIDGKRLADLMIDFNLGVALQDTYEVKQIDTDYFAED